MTTTTGITRKSLDQPDEVRKFAGHGYANVAAIAGGPVLRAHFQPGWRCRRTTDVARVASV